MTRTVLLLISILTTLVVAVLRGQAQEDPPPDPCADQLAHTQSVLRLLDTDALQWRARALQAEAQVIRLQAQLPDSTGDPDEEGTPESE